VIRPRLNFASVIVVLALYFSLGGVASAATAVPMADAGLGQLARMSVAAKKRTPRVHRRKLAVGLRRALVTSRTRPPAGVAGVVGPGIPGETGTAPGRIHYSAHVGPDATPQTAVDYEGFRIRAACVEGEQPGSVGLQIYLYSANDGVLELAVTSGREGSEGGEGAEGGENSPHTNIVKLPLPAGEEQPVGGPGAAPSQHNWMMISGLLVTGERTINITMSLDVDAINGSCAIEGTAVAAS
jgi:hypothetical protein